MNQEVTMRRRLEPIDLVVAVGVFATVLGGYFLYMATNGVLEAATAETSAVARVDSSLIDPMEAMEWVQPALGQAIVDHALLERRAAEEMTRVATRLNRSTLAGYRLQTSPNWVIDRIRSYANAVERDHIARVQYVLGRSIVAFTGRGVRVGVLSPDQLEGDFNRRMIEIAEATGARMEDSYRQMREPMLGWAIVAASRDSFELAGRVQERIGAAVVQVAMAQENLHEAMGRVQEQLASVALASIHTEQIADRFAALAKAEARVAEPVFFSAPQSWPRVSVGVLIGATAILCALFIAGLFMPTYESEIPTMEEALPQAKYRKIA